MKTNLWLLQMLIHGIMKAYIEKPRTCYEATGKIL